MSIKTKASEKGVYFLSLSVENVRCFCEQQTLDLSDGNGRPLQWTVILGENGTGKTTLLEVLQKCIHESFALNKYLVQSLRRSETSRIDAKVILAHENNLENVNSNFKQFAFDHWLPSSRTKDTLLAIRNTLKIFNYSASRRLQHSGKFNVTDSSLNDGGELIDAEEWLLETDYIANKASDIQSAYQKRLETIKEVLINMLPDISGIRISTPSKRSPRPRVLLETPDGWLFLSELSLGYQTMTAWMVDLAARLFEAYPDSLNPIAEPAVVLIDEIDLHLHPKWQRTIMSYLSERFVNTQFIVTAHSPLIVQSAENANIVVLKRGVDGVTIHQQEKDVQGWRIDQLLTSDLFDLGSSRSLYYENKLAQRRQILSKPELTSEDQAHLKALEVEIGDLPSAETAEDIAAMDIIRRAAELLKSSV